MNDKYKPKTKTMQMKRTLITFFSALTITLANGQVLQSVGIQSGVSIANQTWKTAKWTWKMGYRYGPYSTIALDIIKSRYFNITTDVGYCQKGNAEKIEITTLNMPEGTGRDTIFDTKFSYFTWSLLLKIKYTTTHLVPYAVFGPRMDYQLSCRSDFDLQTHNFHNTIWGLTSGVGVEYKIKNIGINTEFNYHYDLTNVMDTRDPVTGWGIEITNKAFIVSFGIKYYLHKTGNKKTIYITR